MGIVIAAIVAICAFVLTSGIASAATRVVNQTDPPCAIGDAYYATIQEAITAAANGDTIIVCNGTYNENVDVNRRLTIRSAYGSENCIVRAKDSNDHVFHVRVNWVNITGFTVQNATMDVTACFSTNHPAAGIYLDLVMYCNISDNNATNNCNGISLFGSSNNILSENTANGNVFRGVLLDSMIPLFYSDHNYLTENTANRNYRGISLLFANNNILTDNTANLNDDIGIEFVQSNDNNFTSNTVNSNAIAGFWLQNSRDNNITCNWIHNNSPYGFYIFGGSTGNTIAYNNIMTNGVEQADGSWKYNFVNEQSNTVTAEDNYWGTEGEAQINASIYDYYDNPALGTVDFSGFLDRPPQCAPIPEAATVLLFSVGLIALVGYTDVQRRRSRK